MPRSASAAKRAAVQRYGAEVTSCDNTLDARVAVLAEVLERTGAVEIHPFDDERVIAGAGTAGLELISEVPDLDVVVTPIGGGGLCSGTCIAVAPVRVIGGSPRDRASSAADGLRTGCSARTGAILRAHGVEEIVVDEPAVVEAMRAVWERTKQVIEPSAAVAFAAARAAGLDGRACGDHLLGRERRPRRACVVGRERSDGDVFAFAVGTSRPPLPDRRGVGPSHA